MYLTTATEAHGRPRARRGTRLRLALGAVLLAAALPFAAAQFGTAGDMRIVVTGGEHEGEYVLTGVTFFFCGFGLPRPGWFSVQYFADDTTAWPSSVQAGHRGPGAPEVETADFVIGFGDLMEDGAGYVIYEARGEGTLETAVEDLGDTARFTLTGTTSTGVGLEVEVVCQDPTRYGE